MKKIITVCLMLLSIILVACGNPNISGTWYYEENDSEREMSLVIDDNKATLKVAYVAYSTSFFSVEPEIKTATLLKGEIDGDKIKFTKSIKAPEGIDSRILSGSETLTYQLSKDKKQLTLKGKEGEEYVFFDKNVSKLVLEEQNDLDEEMIDNSDSESNLSTESYGINTKALIESDTGSIYKAPKSLQKHIGTYLGEKAGEDNYDYGRQVQLKINSDGSFLKLVIKAKKVLTVDEAMFDEIYDSDEKLAYFDKNNKLTVKNDPVISIEGTAYNNIYNLEFSRGVIVERFDKLYLVPFDNWTKSTSRAILSQSGELDIVQSLFAESYLSEGTGDKKTFIDVLDLDDFYQEHLSNHTSEVMFSSDELESMDSIDSDGNVVISEISLSKSDDVSELLSKPLKEVLSYKKIKEAKTLNGLFQFGRHYFSNEADTTNFRVLTDEDKKKIYLENGSTPSSMVGYLSGNSSLDVQGSTIEGLTLFVLVDNKFYGNVHEEDDKFILRD